MSRKFTLGDWVSTKTENWTNWLSQYASVPSVHALEIGSCEGRSTCWFIDNILTGRDSFITCVDPWVPPYSGEHIYKIFKNNISGLRVNVMKETSYSALPKLMNIDSRFDFIYVDGDHEARVLMFDLCASFEMLKNGGVMIIDDYDWCDESVKIPPRPAIDSWLYMNKNVIKKSLITDKINKPEYVQQAVVWK